MTSQGHRGSAGANGRRQLAGENCYALDSCAWTRGLQTVLGHSSRHLEPSRGHCSTNTAVTALWSHIPAEEAEPPTGSTLLPEASSMKAW